MGRIMGGGGDIGGGIVFRKTVLILLKMTDWLALKKTDW